MHPSTASFVLSTVIRSYYLVNLSKLKLLTSLNIPLFTLQGYRHDQSVLISFCAAASFETRCFIADDILAMIAVVYTYASFTDENFHEREIPT